MIISLFIGGFKLRLPLNNPSWSAAYRLAGPVMLASIAGVAVFSHFVFGLDRAVSFLLGAIFAPTDPVLASTVSVNNAADHDRMRYGLSGKAGFNDGAAFPFVIFALMWIEYDGLGSWIGVMLGLNRATVTLSAISLQNAGFIKYRRGLITVLDCEGLEDFTCDRYQIVKQDYDNLPE